MIRKALEWLGGSVLVYVLVAACGSSGGSGHIVSGAGGEGSGGVQGAAGETEDGGLMGDVMNPVPDAMAAAGAGNESCECPRVDPYVPPEPTIVEADCDIVGGSGVMFAEAAFPGKSSDDLARVIALIEYEYNIATKYPASAPAGYAAQLSNIFVRDGYAAASCGSSGQDHVATRVVFTLP
jgi:hypothetical protein